MRNIYTLAAAMVAMASSSHASPFDGFYLGAQIGHNSSEVKINEDITPGSYEYDGDGYDIGVMAGYGRTVVGNIYVGAEVEAEKSSAEIKETFGTTTLKAEKEHSYGASVRVGYAIDQVMPYVRVGMTKAKFKGSATGAYVGSSSESKSGVNVGAGLEGKLTDAVALRGEVTRTNFKKFSDTDGVNTITLKPTETIVRIGASYRF